MVQDGRFNVEISLDGLYARGTFVPAVGDGQGLSAEEVDFELRASGVVQGIDPQLVRRCVEICNTEHKVLRDIVLARGSPGRPRIPEIFVFPPKIQGLDIQFLPPEKFSQLTKDEEGNYIVPVSAPDPAIEETETNTGHIDSHGTIDFREIHGIFIIHEGQVLAALRPQVEGIPGQTVRGEYIPYKTLEVNQLEPGPNTEIRDNRVYSSKNGRFAWNSHSFWVEETLELTQEVGYKTGNIHFPGSLVLKAGIKDGFKIWVGGNMEASGVVDAYEIYCGGNLDAHGGIIGRGKGLVRVRGSLTTRFAEHCDIEVLGPVSIENTALNSLIFTLDTLRTGEKGKIVGGHVQARSGMEVFQLGNAAGVHTEISVGENYVMHRKLDFARDKFQTIGLALHRIEERVKNSSDASVHDQYQRLQEEAQRYQTMMVEILSEINDLEDATLTVFGTIYSGVVVEICRVPLHISKEMKAVRFTLSKENGKIMVESLATHHESHQKAEENKSDATSSGLVKPEA